MDKMGKRERYKVAEINGRQFRIGKFDAMLGSYIAFQVMGEILPMGLGKKVGVEAPPGSPMMSKQAFMEMQKDCLSVCEELLPAGPTPVLNENGSYGVNDIEHDAPLVLNLTIQALIWNITDFFDANLLDSLAGMVLPFFSPGAQT
ncbi:hypothetical protein HMPREF0322_00399 [Desulfitobacterium hafniense DP7]|uniref:Uncharacterized protein n=1 Tax=Desulfitobacterium hafniense DP7 TaxID=537010 RepID=G9XHH4_DESHA|nr:hypothetical protein [Desulfitobacterium hafniense]EHL08976.1 hypothetical protein HMPREF0322_00399 [Desulfitobacterium hafniense DP7]